ncbi:MAG: HD domain-containing phosphohydrolase [Longimicrobiales bacterium]
MTLAAPLEAAARSATAVLYCSPGYDLSAIADALESENIERRDALSLLDVGLIGDTPAVLILDDTIALTAYDISSEAALLPAYLVIVTTPQTAETVSLNDRIVLTLPEGGTASSSLRVLRSAYQVSATRLNTERAERELQRTRNELSEMHRIGVALMTERDPNALLVQILDQAKRLTSSDAGSLYLVEKETDGPGRLRFKMSQNDSLQNLPFTEFTLPIDESSLAGYTATTGKPLVLDDVYELAADAPYTFNRSFDERFGYRTKSMLIVPMVDHHDEVVGILQLMNSKSDPFAIITDNVSADEYVLPYGQHELQLVQSLAGQAAISIENSQLYAQIQNLFESFVKAAVTAIDQRDPTTAGHSIRVAALTVDIAQALERVTRGTYAGTKFTRDQIREMRYAAMLHDFGKVGVREEVLVKAKKLPPSLFERVESRFDLIRRTVEAEYFRKRADYIRIGNMQALTKAEEAFEHELTELSNFHIAVRTANEPAVLPEAAASILDEIALRRYRTPSGDEAPFITSEELHFLSIPKGSLDEHERQEIESHVEQTYRFLLEIPWTDDLKNLANIAYGHHEKLNGKGYPRGISGDQIPVQTRIMTVSDIFDALTASDRPYKRALSTERALSILQMEAGQGLLDSELVEIVIEGELYRKVLEKDWREL